MKSTIIERFKFVETAKKWGVDMSRCCVQSLDFETPENKISTLKPRAEFIKSNVNYQFNGR